MADSDPLARLWRRLTGPAGSAGDSTSLAQVALDAIPDPTGLIDAEGRTLIGNAAFAALPHSGAGIVERIAAEEGEPARAGLIAAWARARKGMPGRLTLGRRRIVVAPAASPPGATLWRIESEGEGEGTRPFERSERALRGLFDEAPIGIVLVDASGTVRSCNRAVETILKLEAGSARGRSLAALVKAEERDAVAERLGRAAAGTEPVGPFEVNFDGGRPVAAAVTASRLEVARGEEPGLILYVLDLAEQKALETQVAQSQKMQAVGRLAGGVAHDFNNLLTAMIGFCDLLLQRHRVGDPSFADIMQIRQNAARAANLVRQLLAFSRQQTLQPKVHDVTDILAELSHLLRRLIGENIELKMTHGRDLHLVRVDQGQLEQVVINLAVNARDAMPEGGRLSIRTHNVREGRPGAAGQEGMPTGDYVLIEISDTGVGIPREIIGRIFEPFFSTKEVGAGTGLGLAMVYGIVKQTGGYIFVDSEPGQGTTIAIYLPATAGEVAQREVRAPPPGLRRDLTGTGTILLVEDEDPVRLFSARALRNKGYTVIEAKNGESALQQLRGHAGTIDLLVTDVVMPQMDGATLVRIVHEERPDLKVICISGYAEETFRNRLSGQDIRFLPKPYSLEQLARTVKDTLVGAVPA